MQEGKARALGQGLPRHCTFPLPSREIGEQVDRRNSEYDESQAIFGTPLRPRRRRSHNRILNRSPQLIRSRSRNRIRRDGISRSSISRSRINRHLISLSRSRNRSRLRISSCKS
jgi:hypothetical protein